MSSSLIKLIEHQLKMLLSEIGENIDNYSFQRIDKYKICLKD